MDIEKEYDKVFQQYKSYTTVTLGLAYLREPFSEPFRELVGLTDDSEYVKSFDIFMKITDRIFMWHDYLEARTTAEQTFRRFYDQQQYPETEKEYMLEEFIISFFNQIIDESQIEWQNAHPGQQLPEPTENDIDTLYLARVFAVIPYKREDEEFCESIGVQYHYEQLHMCTWFSGQVTNGEGHYSRDKVNYSARTTYNRLANPRSLLWIGVVFGADKEELKAAAEEIENKKTVIAKCGAVRKHVPFDTILQLYNKMMYEEEAE